MFQKQKVPSGLWKQQIEDLRWGNSFAISFFCHLILLFLMKQFWVSSSKPQKMSEWQSEWTQPVDISEKDLQQLLQDRNPLSDATTLRMKSGGASPSTRSAQQLAIRDISTVDVSFDVMSMVDAEQNLPLTEPIGKVSFIRSSLLENGNGNGKGNGKGDGTGGDNFFGKAIQGGSFVFVVDCSRSMNHPHESEAKTRFRRLKQELIKALRLMGSHQQFFIIFFNEEPVPMPGRTLQSATTTTKYAYAKWILKQQAIGDTDPRTSLLMALRMRPDVIYFLTDGSFTAKVQRDLEKLEQKQTIIHTYAFGEREAAPFLERLAKRNQGQFTFVP